MNSKIVFFFSEREENVKADIFTAYRALLTRSKPSSQKQQQLVGEGEAMEVTDRSVGIKGEQSLVQTASNKSSTFHFLSG